MSDEADVEATGGASPETIAGRVERRLARSDRFGGTKPPSGPTELTAKMRLLIDYVVFGCGHVDICAAHGVEPNTPLGLVEAAGLLGIRRRQARELSTLPLFAAEMARQVAALRSGAKAKAVHRIIGLIDEAGEGSAADRKIQLEASKTILDDGSKGGVNVNIRNNVLSAGYIIDLDSPRAPPAIEGLIEPGAPGLVMRPTADVPRVVLPGEPEELPADMRPEPISADGTATRTWSVPPGGFCPVCGVMFARGRVSCNCEVEP
jgi:hypothetical protein